MSPRNTLPVPRDGQVHVWRVCLDRIAVPLDRWEDTLSALERRRADQFRFERYRRRFIVRRGVLRSLLSQYLRMPAGDVPLNVGPLGKPALARSERDADLRFNYSHSNGLAAYAFAVRQEVGVDIERIRPVAEMDEIAHSILTARERLSLDHAADYRLEQFFHLWTSKEAVLKTTGEGLTRSPASIEIGPGPTEAFRVARGDAGSTGHSQWSLRPLAIASGFVGAVAVPRPHHGTITLEALDYVE
jgi:4'-phosphopantetheinyl transferase